MTETASTEIPETEPKTKAKKAPKPKAPKVLSLEKKRELLFTSYFLKATVRRLGFWYKGLNIGIGYNFIMGSLVDDDFSHGDPKFSISLVSIHNNESIETLDAFFRDVGLMDNRIEIVNMKELATQCSKVKWDVSKLTFSRDAHDRLICVGEHHAAAEDENKKFSVISTPLISLFVLGTVKTAIEHYRKIIDSDRSECYTLPFESDDAPYGIIDIDKEELKRVPKIYERFKSQIKVATVRGLDLLQKKPLLALDPDVKLSYLFWRPYDDASVVDYIHIAEGKDFTIALSRCYVQVYP